MRDYPTTFTEFIEKHNLNSNDLKPDLFVKRGKEDIIFRNDFGFLVLYLDLKSFHGKHGELDLDTPLQAVFPEAQRDEKWNEFRECTILNIPDLESRDTKSGIYFSIFFIAMAVGIILVFSNRDLSFFTLLHPEILMIGFIIVVIFIVGIDYLAKKVWPDDKIPYSVNSDIITGFIGRVLTYNRHKIKAEFAKLYLEIFRDLKNEYSTT